MPKQDAYHILRGRVLGARIFLFFFYTAKSLVRSFHRAIIEALSSPCQALAFEGFPTRAVCSSPATRAGKSPVTSLAHGTCTACHAGPPEHVVPGAHSARSANGTRGAQHVMPRRRARMGTPVCRIQTLAAILAVHEALLNPTRSVSVPGSRHEDARARAAH